MRNFDPAPPLPRDASSPSESGSFSLISLWQITWNQKWRIFGSIVALMMLGFILTGAKERTYTAESLLILEDHSASLSTALTRDDNAYVNPSTAVEVFGSRPVIEEVVTALALDQDPEFNPFLPEAQVEPSQISKLIAALWTHFFGQRKAETPAAELPVDYINQEIVARVEASVQFLIIPQTSLIHVRATTLAPEKSAQLANAVSEAFLNDALRSRLDSVDRVVAQLGDRLVKLQLDFHNKEQALQDFKNEAEILDPSALSFMAAEVARLRERRKLMAVDLEAAIELEAAVQAIDGLDANIRTDRIAQSAELSTLRNAVGTSSRQMLAEAQRQREQLDEQARKLDASIDKLERRVTVHSERLLHLAQLEREKEASGEIYEFSLRRLNELSVQADVETSGGRIVFSAHTPQTGNSRGRLRTMLVLGFLGFIVSVTWVLIKEANTQTLRKVGDLKTLRPTARIIAVPSAPVKGMPWNRKTDLKQMMGINVTPFSSGIRRLRASVLALSTEKPIAVHVASDVVSTEKSLLTLALGWSLTHVNKKVLIINADGTMAEVIRPLLKATVPNGLENVLNHGEKFENAVVSPTKMGIDLLLNNRQENHMSTDLLELHSFKLLLDFALERYDIVLIDTPPVLVAPDALQVARYVNKTLFVVGSNMSSSDSLETGLDELLPVNASTQNVLVLYGDDTTPTQVASRYNRKVSVT